MKLLFTAIVLLILSACASASLENRPGLQGPEEAIAAHWLRMISAALPEQPRYVPDKAFKRKILASEFSSIDLRPVSRLHVADMSGAIFLKIKRIDTKGDLCKAEVFFHLPGAFSVMNFSLSRLPDGSWRVETVQTIMSGRSVIDPDE